MTIAVIAKAPVAGLVKTRLCPPCTPRQAAAIAAAALRDTLASVRRVPTARRVVVLDGEPGSWLGPGIETIPQRGEGLDERLAAAFADLGGPALVVGMDTPQVRPELLAHGLARLSRAPAVIGPALDGGYWAIGLRKPDERALLGVPMSRASTCAHQLARLRDLGLEAVVLPTLRDVDTAADAAAVAPTLGSASAFRTAVAAAGLRERIA